MTEPVPGSALFLGPRQVMDLLSISQRQAQHPFEHDLVDVFLSEWRGSPYRYALVNERMAAWAQRHERWIRASRVRCGLASGLLERHKSLFLRRDPEQGYREVYAGYVLLRWAARQRAGTEKNRILKGQILTSNMMGGGGSHG